MNENVRTADHFIFDGCDTVELAKKYGTPLYVISNTNILERCREIRDAF
ncbi:MAG: diaminopimelate decarboxylase, partial [Clostridiales bacterium]|nr:diaminopimelate decarboxylase [Clostridiales bacterium]